ncbi:hypothetical protein [Thermosulfuriphilus sp.]
MVLIFLGILLCFKPALASEEGLPVVPGPPALPPGRYLLGPLDFASGYAGYTYLRRQKVDIHQYILKTYQEVISKARQRALKEKFSGVCYFDLRFEFTDDMVVWYGRWTYYREVSLPSF